MRYIPLLRPASHATLPDALQWSYVEAPAYITGRPDLPRSRHSQDRKSTRLNSSH